MVVESLGATLQPKGHGCDPHRRFGEKEVFKAAILEHAAVLKSLQKLIYEYERKPQELNTRSSKNYSLALLTKLSISTAQISKFAARADATWGASRRRSWLGLERSMWGQDLRGKWLASMSLQDADRQKQTTTR